MADTVFVRGAGGAIFQMDVPTNPHQREAWDAKLERGELVVIPDADVEATTRVVGRDKAGNDEIVTTFTLRTPSTDSDPEPARSGRRNRPAADAANGDD